MMASPAVARRLIAADAVRGVGACVDLNGCRGSPPVTFEKRQGLDGRRDVRALDSYKRALFTLYARLADRMHEVIGRADVAAHAARTTPCRRIAFVAARLSRRVHVGARVT